MLFSTYFCCQSTYGRGVSFTRLFLYLSPLLCARAGGPNGPSDMVGGANATLIRSTITGDGTNLKADRPAITVQSALSAAFADQPIPLVTATWSQHGGYRCGGAAPAPSSLEKADNRKEVTPASYINKVLISSFAQTLRLQVALHPGCGADVSVHPAVVRPGPCRLAQHTRLPFA